MSDTPLRHVRARCVVEIGDAQVAAYSSAIGLERVHLRVQQELTEGMTLDPGSRARIHFQLPDQPSPLNLAVRIDTRGPDVDIGGLPCVALDCAWLELSPSERERLQSFVVKYRHTVLLS